MSPESDPLEQLIHIIPIGYEIDRVIYPFTELKAHRVHLISMAETPAYDTPRIMLSRPGCSHMIRKIVNYSGTGE